MKERTVAVNLIVLAVTLLVAGFVVVWACFPEVRDRIETPKYRVLQWRRRFTESAPSRPAEEEREGRP
jgi:hypothetical protein